MSTLTIQPRTVQRRASNPKSSAWVDASAGTGKTTVLTERVLRLLLDGAAPERILCITFTRAAAAEMSNRIIDKLGQWAVMDDRALEDSLVDLIGGRPTAEMRGLARQLFARIVDTAAGMRIQTIHAFCQSVLRRFPVEAGLAPHFDLLDDRTRDEMLAEAQRDLLVEAGTHPNGPLGKAIAALVEHMNEQGFAELMQAVIAARRELTAALDAHGGAGLLIPAMWRGLGLEPGDDEAAALVEACLDMNIDGVGLRAACARLSDGSPTDKARAAAIEAWLSAPDRRQAGWDAYRAAFLTQKDEPNGTYARTKAHQEFAHVLDREAYRLAEICDRLRRIATARTTDALLAIASALLARYQAAKAARAVLDYDDLIEETRRLLEREGYAAWVLYKLDGGVDHILLDEAQDTNPEQWRIIEALASEFFAGQGAREGRTIFVVGDEKQSIYSFQGSDPTALARLKRVFESRILAAEAEFQPVDLDLSFRSTEPVLALVDAVFSTAAARDGVLSDPESRIRHRAHRQGHAGLVELWKPFIPAESDETLEPWTPPVDPMEIEEPEARLAARIADQVQGWIDRGEMLHAEGRPIAPGDIMILVRRRTRFVGPMVRALKTRGIPVAGIDRLALTEPLAVQDLMALGRFLLLQEDDLTLAALLKSPLVGLPEERLFEIAHGRKGSLWRSLAAAAERHPAAYEPARAWLAQQLAEVDYRRPFELYAKVLAGACPGDSGEGGSGRRALWRRLGPDAIDPLDEFLTAALDYERRHTPTLEGFIGWLEASEAEVKRELAGRSDSVRIVTVHGAKGLEAPIVFLPDTMQPPRSASGPALLWSEGKNGRPVPYWVPRAELRPRFCADLAEASRRKVDQEYRRLLYVALTRARDRLYVCGWRGSRSTGDNHWHALVEAGMQVARAIETEEDGRTVLRIDQPQTKPARGPASSADAETAPPLPAWARRKAPAEPRPTRPLTPSRVEAPGVPEQPVRSPSSPDEARRFRRGRAMHRLLQSLPDFDPAGRAAAGQRLAADFPDDEREALVAEALAVIDDPAFARYFGPSSRAEVPVVGRVGTRGVAGRIDRLLVEPEQVTIIDFKSGRTPPEGYAQVPPAYLAQMAAYRAVLRQIYPDRSIALVLVWTDGPAAIALDPKSLDPYEQYLLATPAA